MLLVWDCGHSFTHMSNVQIHSSSIPMAHVHISKIDMPTVHMSKHAYAKRTHVKYTHVTHTHVTHTHVKQAYVKHTFLLNVHTSFSYYLVCCTGKHWPQITAGDSCASCLPCRHGIDPCSTASRQPTRCRPRRPCSKTSSRMLKWSCGSIAQRSFQSGR